MNRQFCSCLQEFFEIFEFVFILVFVRIRAMTQMQRNWTI